MHTLLHLQFDGSSALTLFKYSYHRYLLRIISALYFVRIVPSFLRQPSPFRHFRILLQESLAIVNPFPIFLEGRCRHGIFLTHTFPFNTIPWRNFKQIEKNRKRQEKESIDFSCNYSFGEKN